MVKPVNDRDEPALEVDQDPGEEPETPLSDLLEALVEVRGRAPAAEVLRVNYRTLAFCRDSRQVSRWMRRALLEFRNANNTGSGDTEGGDGDRPPNGGMAALEQRVSDLEHENSQLRDLADEQTRQMEEWAHRVAALDGGRQPGGDSEGNAGDDVHVDEPKEDRTGDTGQSWRPLLRRPPCASGNWRPK